MADPFTLWQDDYRRVHQTALDAIDAAIRAELGFPPADVQILLRHRPPTPPDEHIEEVLIAPPSPEPEPAPIIDPQHLVELHPPFNVHPGEPSEAIFQHLLLSMNSARWKMIFLDIFRESWFWLATVCSSAVLQNLLQDFLQEALERRALHPGFTLETGWKMIFLDIFRESWFWLATVCSSAVLQNLLQDFLQEALERRALHPGFTLETVNVAPVGSDPVWTRSDDLTFVTAFKDAMSDATKLFQNYCYARSKDLLVNIISENYFGILRASLHPIPADLVDYIRDGMNWDPRWGYNILHNITPGANNLVSIDWFGNAYLKEFLRAAMNPASRGWFGVAMYTQGQDGTAAWRAVSHPNMELITWLMSWFIVTIIVDALRMNSWGQSHVTAMRLKAVLTVQGKLKRLIDGALALNLPGVPLGQLFRARHGRGRASKAGRAGSVRRLMAVGIPGPEGLP
ncbi:hypothetical protein HYDPIDRAFT_168927 [Hydnomerulius pinastri MD-312]|uniref:Uncharacterized protein n=1 Tax=Hydnomerulius pinastri MD-312 TaxID=994086 RepID=A0A0C9WCX1_9AGAM|nr:hypothetical protein HYDPIDRAFT_168927 [Hydnomerulius pinastri MD-312]